MVEGLRRRMARLARMAERRQETAGGDVAEGWARVFAALDGSEREPSALARERAGAFVMCCQAQGVKPTWVELVGLAGDPL